MKLGQVQPVFTLPTQTPSANGPTAAPLTRVQPKPAQKPAPTQSASAPVSQGAATQEAAAAAAKAPVNGQQSPSMSGVTKLLVPGSASGSHRPLPSKFTTVIGEGLGAAAPSKARALFISIPKDSPASQEPLSPYSVAARAAAMAAPDPLSPFSAARAAADGQQVAPPHPQPTPPQTAVAAPPQPSPPAAEDHQRVLTPAEMNSKSAEDIVSHYAHNDNFSPSLKGALKSLAASAVEEGLGQAAGVVTDNIPFFGAATSSLSAANSAKDSYAASKLGLPKAAALHGTAAAAYGGGAVASGFGVPGVSTGGAAATAAAKAVTPPGQELLARDLQAIKRIEKEHGNHPNAKAAVKLLEERVNLVFAGAARDPQQAKALKAGLKGMASQPEFSQLMSMLKTREGLKPSHQAYQFVMKSDSARYQSGTLFGGMQNAVQSTSK